MVGCYPVCGTDHMGLFERFEDETPAFLVAGMVAFLSIPVFFFIFIGLMYIFPRIRMEGWALLFPGLPLIFLGGVSVFVIVFEKVRES
jgi:hypothetical protein